MIDVCGNDRTAARDLGPHKLWCYFIRDLGTKTFAGMLLSEIVAGDCGIRNSEFGIFGSRTGFFIPHSAFRIPHLLPDCNEFHFGRDDALARVPKLRDTAARARTKRATLCRS